MSGIEPFAVLGLISSLIAIIDGAAKLCDAAKDSYGRHAAVRKIGSHLPIVLSTLHEAEKAVERAKHKFDQANDEVTRDTIRHNIKILEPLFEGCEQDAKSLQELMEDMIKGLPLSTGRKYVTIMQRKLTGKERRAVRVYKDLAEKLQLLRDHQLLVDSTKFNEERTNILRPAASLPTSSSSSSSEVVDNLPFNRGRAESGPDSGADHRPTDHLANAMLQQCVWNNSGNTKVQNQGVQVLQGGQTIAF